MTSLPLSNRRNERPALLKFRRRMELEAVRSGNPRPEPFAEMMVRKWGELISAPLSRPQR